MYFSRRFTEASKGEDFSLAISGEKREGRVLKGEKSESFRLI